MSKFKYINQMQYQEAIEETIRVIGIIIVEKDYCSMTELRESLSITHLNYCMQLIKSRVGL